MSDPVDELLAPYLDVPADQVAEGSTVKYGERSILVFPYRREWYDLDLDSPSKYQAACDYYEEGWRRRLAEDVLRALGVEPPRFRNSWPDRRWSLHLGRPVKGDGIFGGTRATTREYAHHEIDVNPNGAVAVLGKNGKFLGLKPDEFTWTSPPPWPSWPNDDRACNACNTRWGGTLTRCYKCGSEDVRALSLFADGFPA